MPVHVHPENDIVDHELTEKCVCGPRLDARDGSEYPNGPLYIHHSLDGREGYENKPGAVMVDLHEPPRRWLCTNIDTLSTPIGPPWITEEDDQC